MAKKEKPVEASKELKAFKEKIIAVLHSNGLDGTVAGQQITDAVGEYTGEDMSPEAPKEENHGKEEAA